MDEAKFSAAVGRLRAAVAEIKVSPLWNEIVAPRESVLAQFQPIFSRTHIPQLTAEEFRPFLYFEHNHHWTGLYRQVNRITADMPALRQALLVLTDEDRPITARLDEVGDAIFGMGRGIITAILTVAFPEKYGVWNTVSQGGLVQLQLWPTFPRGMTFGSQYTAINEILLRLAGALDIDLWTLDALFWHLGKPGEMPKGALTVSEETPVVSPPLDEPPLLGFGLERHLHQFLFDNWNQTSLGKEWALYTVPGDPEAGYEFACAAGRIDLLARHKTEKKWLVVELKRDATSDETVGQALRYMGWVQLNLAEPGEEVHGLIVAQAVDRLLAYAIAPVRNLTAMSYEVNFRLVAAPAASADR
jgi:hypothetical protein